MGIKNRSRKQRKSKQQVSDRAASEFAAPGKFAVPREWIIWLILGVTFLAFSNSLLNGFAYDDTTQILENQFIRDLKNLPKALVTETWYWRTQQDQDPNKQEKPSTPYYRPVFVIYLMAIWALFGTWAPGWHLFNVLLHVMAVYFVFAVIERITRDSRVSVIASLIFALHPLRSESIAWVSGVTDPLVAVFILTSFAFYMRYREGGGTKLLVGSLLMFLLAVLTKEPAVALPIFIGVYEIFVVNQDKGVREKIRTAITHAAYFGVIAAVYFAARWYALGFALNNAEFRSYPVHWIMFTIPLAIWKYFGLLFWPVGLSPFHATPMVRSPLDWRFILPLLGLIGLIVVLRPLWRSTLARFGILWFVINLFPVLNLSAFDENFLVQERYIYIPSIGFSLLAAMALAKAPVEKWLPFSTRSKAQAVLATALLLLLAGKSVAQNAVWKDDMSVWRHGVATAPEQPMSHYILGHKLINQGDYPSAAAELEDFVKINQENSIVLGNLASCYVLIYQNQVVTGSLAPDRAPLDRAFQICEMGLKVTLESPVIWDALGSIHTFDTGLKNYDRALACFDRALRMNPDNGMINFHIGGTLIKKGQYDDGIRFLQTALKQAPSIVDAHKFLAHAYKSKGQFKEAIEQLSTYLQLQPNAPDASKVSKDVQDLRTRLQVATPQS